MFRPYLLGVLLLVCPLLVKGQSYKITAGSIVDLYGPSITNFNCNGVAYTNIIDALNHIPIAITNINITANFSLSAPTITINQPYTNGTSRVRLETQVALTGASSSVAAIEALRYQGSTTNTYGPYTNPTVNVFTNQYWWDLSPSDILLITNVSTGTASAGVGTAHADKE